MRVKTLSSLNWKFSAVALAAAALLAGGCGGQDGAGGAPPAMAVPVVAVEAKAERLNEAISLVGTLLADEFVEIKSEIDAQVVEIGFREGERVDQGRLLLSLDDGKLSAELARAEADFRWAETNLERTRALLERETVSRQEFDQAQATYEANRAALQLARRNLAEATIRAPFSGRLGARLVSPGQYVAKGMALTTLVAADPLKLEFNAPERFVGRLSVGQTVDLSSTAFPGESFRGEVYFVSPRVDPSTRTVLVKAVVPNADDRLKPGMFASLTLVLAVRENAVVIPETALVFQAETVSVYVVQPDNTVQLRTVKLGIRLPGRVEVTEGVSVGDKVVVEGVQKLGPGAPVQVSLETAPSHGAAALTAR